MGLALATGSDLVAKTVWGLPKRVWLWNLEDSRDELNRAVMAAVLHWRIQQHELANTMFIDSGLDGDGLILASEDQGAFRLNHEVVDAMIAALKRHQIDVVIIDPFVSSHRASENDNGAIDAIAKAWAKIAVAANCAVLLVHHSAKMKGAEISAEASRGASALANAARSVLTPNRMSPDEATRFGIEGEDRRRYFRVYDDKNNRAPPADQSDWYQLLSVSLPNGPEGADGDSLPVVVPWSLRRVSDVDVAARLAEGARRTGDLEMIGCWTAGMIDHTIRRMRAASHLLTLVLIVGCGATASAQSIDDGIQSAAAGKDAEAIATFLNIDTPEAQYNLGFMAETGRYVGCDRLYCASAWYLKSARRGLVLGMTAVGRLNYNNGYPAIGVEWLTLAEKQGSADARQMLAQIEVQQQALAQQQAARDDATRQAQAQAANTWGFLLGCAIAGGGCGASPTKPSTTYAGQHGVAALSSRQLNSGQSQCGYVTPSGRVTVVVSGACPETYSY